MQVTERLGYRRSLDGFRGLAVGGVVASHYGLPFLYGAAVGVFLFFVLSGFLITTLLLEERDCTGGIDLPRFYGRRALRLFPALSVVIAVTVLYMLTIGAPPDIERGTLGSVAPALLYYANWELFVHGTDGGVLGWFSHMWSLSVEEQFYLVWPALLVFGRRWPLRRLALGLAITSAAVLLVRLGTYRDSGDVQFLFGSHAIADQMAVGCLLAVGLRMAPVSVARVTRLMTVPALGVLAAASLAFNVTSPGFRGLGSATVGLTLIALASATVIGAVVTSPSCWLARLLATRAPVFVGRISYGIYLWHILIGNGLDDQSVLPTSIRVPIAVGLTIVVASVSFFLMERPLQRRFHARLAGSRRESALVATSVA